MDESRLEGMLNGKAHANGHQVATKIESQAATLHRDWATDPRWSDIERPYSAADVVRSLLSALPTEAEIDSALMATA